MKKPPIRSPVKWDPKMLVVITDSRIRADRFYPDTAREHFIVNSSRQCIMRAMVSSRAAMKNKHQKD